MHIPHSQTSKINSSREHELAIYTIHNKNLRVYSVFCTPLSLFFPHLYQCYRFSPYPTSSAPAAIPSSPCPTGPAPPPCLPAPGGRVSQFLHHCSGSSLCPRCWSSFSIVRLSKRRCCCGHIGHGRIGERQLQNHVSQVCRLQCSLAGKEKGRLELIAWLLG